VRDLELRLQKSNLAVEMLERTLERELQLTEGNLKQQTIVADQQMRSTVAELKYQICQAKRQVMTFVALHFSAFFDTEKELDDDEFEAVLTDIKTKLIDCIAMESKVRNLLHIGPRQSIEAEIVRLLLANKC
jgi:hypothetical protein